MSLKIDLMQRAVSRGEPKQFVKSRFTKILLTNRAIGCDRYQEIASRGINPEQTQPRQKKQQLPGSKIDVKHSMVADNGLAQEMGFYGSIMCCHARLIFTSSL